MKNNCCTSCGDQNKDASAQRTFTPVVEQDAPLVFDIQKRPSVPEPYQRKAVQEPSKTMVETTEPKNEVVAYEKTTIIDDEPLKPREEVASGWFWAGVLLIGGGIVYRAL